MTKFTFKGTEQSSDLPNVRETDGTETPRAAFWDREATRYAQEHVPATTQANPKVYIATGGGYGANDGLFEYLRDHPEQGVPVSKQLPLIAGDYFRDLPVLQPEVAEVRAAATAFLKDTLGIAEPSAEDVTQTVRAYYSDEANTKLGKEAIKKSIALGKPVAYNSASIYPDTQERAELARDNGVPSVMIAGDSDLAAAIEKKKATVSAESTAKSYKEFATRFDQWVQAFDQVYLYNTDSPTPQLIARKAGREQPLEILDAGKFAAFQAKKNLDIASYKTPVSEASVINREWHERDAQSAALRETSSWLEKTTASKGAGDRQLGYW